jgi:pimeloyl-ACP methyl ester carboxylesterase
LQWLHRETQQRVLLFGISLGGTIALQAAASDPHLVKAVVGISADSHTARGDAAADLFLRDRASQSGPRVRRAVSALEPPPYLSLASFQRRARLLADLGAIEHKRRSTALLRELLISVFRTYGVVGGVKALRNLSTIQGRLLAEVATLDLLSHPPRVTVPVHYVFGAQDALNSESMVTDLPAAIAAPDSTMVRLHDAGHMAHFDQPEIVRSIVERV